MKNKGKKQQMDESVFRIDFDLTVCMSNSTPANVSKPYDVK